MANLSPVSGSGSIPGNWMLRSPSQVKTDSGVRWKIPVPLKGGGGRRMTFSGDSFGSGTAKVELSATTRAERWIQIPCSQAPVKALKTTCLEAGRSCPAYRLAVNSMLGKVSAKAPKVAVH